MLKVLASFAVAGTLLAITAMAAGSQTPGPTAGELLASGLQGSIGGVIGPDGALYVPEGATGEITRVDPNSGATSTFASGLPPAPFGGAIDVAFVGDTAYALVTLVDVSGIYRMDGAASFTVIADIGAFAADNLPPYPVDVPAGLQYALELIDGGFVVSDGHHNRIYHVTMAGVVTELISFSNVVPTGLAVDNGTLYFTEIGPVPHVPSDGKVLSLSLSNPRASDVASGYSLIVDVEVGPDGELYALSQGDSPGEVPPASPAAPDSGKLLRVNDDGTFTVLVDGMDLPTTLVFAGDDALIVTLNGEVWQVDGASGLKPVTPGGPVIAPPSAGSGGLAAYRAATTATFVAVVVAIAGGLALMWRRVAA